ncbi:hypothetical protein EYF80_030388 [Liparis tanakae]|uniref:Uncharacterized protein n=1 Tax=Liparis tanakae TaxID=230148 RepID=A0A4Z2H2R0_9TELE|nr:hypothetical protein EYF80_030388 [Liparis tanakae]
MRITQSQVVLKSSRDFDVDLSLIINAVTHTAPWSRSSAAHMKPRGIVGDDKKSVWPWTEDGSCSSDHHLLATQVTITQGAAGVHLPNGHEILTTLPGRRTLRNAPEEVGVLEGLWLTSGLSMGVSFGSVLRLLVSARVSRANLVHPAGTRRRTRLTPQSPNNAGFKRPGTRQSH